MPRLRVLLLLGAALASSGCATRGSLVLSCPDLQPRAVEVSALDRSINCNAPGQTECLPGVAALDGPKALPARDFADDMASDIAAALADSPAVDAKAGAALPAAPAPRADVLLLSGGGQWGAYGAGLLQGLHGSGSPQDPVPRYGTLTGISTGTMQGLFIAGHRGGYSRAYDEMVRHYQPRRESEIVDRSPNWSAVIKGSVSGLKPLKALIETALDTPDTANLTLLEAIGRSDAPFYAGFVDFGANRLMTADMRRLARLPRSEARACVTAVALASAAIPMRFQQVRIRHREGKQTVDRTYADGGLVRSVFMARIASALEEGTQRAAAARGIHDVSTPTLFVLRNGPTFVEEARRRARLDGRNINAIAAVEETISSLVNRMEQDAIIGLRIDHPAGPIRFSTANGHDRFRWQPVDGPPQTGCTRRFDGTQFDPDFMRCLVAYGRLRAAEGPWSDLPEALSARK